MRGSSDGRYGLDNFFILKGVRIPLKDLFCKPFKISEVGSLKIYYVKSKKLIKSKKIHKTIFRCLDFAKRSMMFSGLISIS